MKITRTCAGGAFQCCNAAIYLTFRVDTKVLSTVNWNFGAPFPFDGSMRCELDYCYRFFFQAKSREEQPILTTSVSSHQLQVMIGACVDVRFSGYIFVNRSSDLYF